jgi:hypothetical protein
MRYEFGVMSSKFELEANNDDIAFFTMVMFMRHASIPIVIYIPYKKVINARNIIDVDNAKEFVEKNLVELRKCYNTIKEI